MSSEQKQLIEMAPGDSATINGHKVLKSGIFWVIDIHQSTADLAKAARLCGEIRCNCDNPDRPGHPVVGYCREAIGGKRL